MQTNLVQVEDVLFQALAHPMRRNIIEIIAAYEQGITYTELITDLGLSTGKLNYHIEQLSGLIAKNDGHRYVLTPFGKKALSHLCLAKKDADPQDENYVRTAYLSQRASLQPAVRLFLLMGLVFSFLVMFIWFYIAYIAIVEDAPIIVYAILPVLIAFGVVLIGSLIYALVKTPIWVKRFEQRFFGPT